MRTTWALLLISSLPLGGGLQAQRIGGPSFPFIVDTTVDTTLPPNSPRFPPPLAEPDNEVGTAWLVTGGVLAGAAAGFGGMYAGALLTSGCEDCSIAGAVYGLIGGVSTGIPLGVHYTNGARGSLPKAVATSLAIGGLGLGAALVTDEPAILFGTPVVQLASSILIERGTGR